MGFSVQGGVDCAGVQCTVTGFIVVEVRLTADDSGDGDGGGCWK